jgi:methionine synthase II (cobalamin-independent)
VTDREKARDLGNHSAALARSIADVLNDTLDALEAAEAEVARLREALTEIATPMPENEGDWGENYNWHAVAKRRRDIARAALGEDA